MTGVRTLLNRLSSRQTDAEDGDLVLGLPLESDGRTIYPVFVDPGATRQNGAEPRQIGYLEISQDRSDFTSLEPANRPPVAVVLGLAALLLVVAFWLLRARRGNQPDNRTR